MFQKYLYVYAEITLYFIRNFFNQFFSIFQSHLEKCFQKQDVNLVAKFS